MIQNLLARLAAIAATIIAIFSLGNYLGKKSQKIKQLEEDFEDVLQSKKRQNNRRYDDISVVRKRMQKYLRK